MSDDAAIPDPITPGLSGPDSATPHGAEVRPTLKAPAVAGGKIEIPTSHMAALVMVRRICQVGARGWRKDPAFRDNRHMLIELEERLVSHLDRNPFDEDAEILRREVSYYLGSRPPAREG